MPLLTKESIQVALLGEQMRQTRVDVAELGEMIKSLARDLKMVQETLTEQRGGWRFAMWAGSFIGAALVSIVAVAPHIRWI